jgi:hypothetical protein
VPDPAPRYWQALDQVVTDLQAEFGPDLLGILWAGSVAAGTPFAESDLDVYGVIGLPWRQRRTRWVEGVEVELFLNPVRQIRSEFALTEHPATIAMFAQGQILWDPEGAIAQLVAEARRIWEAGRPLVPAGQRWQLTYPMVDLLTDVRDLLDRDEAGSTLLLVRTLEVALEAHYRFTGRWSVKPKYLLSDLAGHAPELERLARQVLEPNASLAQRYEWLAEFVGRVLAPMGGHPREWESARDPVDHDPNLDLPL